MLRLLLVKDVGTKRRPTRRGIAARRELLGAGAGDDRDRCNVGGLVAKGDAEAECQKDGKYKDPEDDLGLALEFKQTSGQKMV